MTLDITIGSTERISSSGSSAGAGPAGEVLEGRVLNVRRARGSGKRGGGAATERRGRNARQARDPLGARVVTLMIPEGHRLPPRLASDGYRALVRFVKR
ncbi:MAG: hypothetical protein ACE5IK_04530 [Acidobacteriota bacterium]